MDKVVYGFDEWVPQVSDSFQFTAELAGQHFVKMPDGRTMLAITEGIVDGYCLKDFEKLLRMDSEEAQSFLTALEEPDIDEEEEPPITGGSPWPEELVEYAKLNGYSGVSRPMISFRSWKPYPEYEYLNIIVFGHLSLRQFARWEVKFVGAEAIEGRKIWPKVEPWEVLQKSGKVFEIKNCPKDMPKSMGRKR
jgi:hypothetical protein